jgi:hypothetical protein
MSGVATRGNTVSFGDFALQAIEPAWITSRQISAGAAKSGFAFFPTNQSPSAQQKPGWVLVKAHRSFG